MRFLTKSKFKVALECPTKLFYSDNDYQSNKVDNPFLQSLANGGFQVGELAKCYHPFGYAVQETNQHLAVKRTEELLKKERVTIYEAAFLYKNMFVRVDILVKRGNQIELIEVKSKTFDSSDPKNFTTKEEIGAEWKEHMFDIAFQRYVITNIRMDFNVVSFLCLVDKATLASVDGLNQRFFIERDGNQVHVKKHGKLTKQVLGNKLLGKVNVDNYMARLWSGEDKQITEPFPELVERIAEQYKTGIAQPPRLSAGCATCEFRCGTSNNSGFGRCWTLAAGFEEADFTAPSTLDLWAASMGGKKAQLIREGKYFMRDVGYNDIAPASYKIPDYGMSPTDRRLLQIEKSITNNKEPFLDSKGLLAEMETWVYPMHFIDFETTAVAIPFNKGRRPYEQIAFQFSHHIVDAKGKVTHHNEWINRKVGDFPNFEFVRALKASLGESGTVFRYAAHENSILNTIRQQLLQSEEVDREELAEWVKTVTKSTLSATEKWHGERNMVDMCELVKRYYYHPLTEGKNSIKAVMEGILSTSLFLQKKYSRAIYGTTQMRSHNFKNKAWVVKEDGKIVNPYKLLPKLFDGLDEQYLLSHTDELKDGGAAMSAYARMQYTKMSQPERDAIINGLLKYCELDTLAMVMLYQEWKNEVKA